MYNFTCFCTVIYANKFLQTKNYKAHKAAGKIAVKEFGTDPCQSRFGRLKGKISGGVYGDFENPNVSVKVIAGKLCAMTETPLPIEFYKETLDQVGGIIARKKKTGKPKFSGSCLSKIIRFVIACLFSQIHSKFRYAAPPTLSTEDLHVVIPFFLN